MVSGGMKGEMFRTRKGTIHMMPTQSHELAC